MEYAAVKYDSVCESSALNRENVGRGAQDYTSRRRERSVGSLLGGLSHQRLAAAV